MAATADITASPTSPSQRWDYGPACLADPISLGSPSHALAVTALVQRKLVPSTHMRWRMTPSLRASATRAFFVPRRLATAIAQLFRGDMRTVRLSITLAASYSAVRTIRSPTLLIEPVTSISPDWYLRGVSPK